MVRVPRFFIAPQLIDSKSSLVRIADPRLVAQIAQVLRLRVGDEIDVLDGLGHIYRCSLKSLVLKKGLDASLEAKIESSSKTFGEERVKIEVAIPILRVNRYEWALEKLTELGVSSIVPILVKHAVHRGAKLERWRAIVREAAEQSERGLVPEVVAPISLIDYLQRVERMSQGQVCFICCERSNAQTLPVVLCNRMADAPHKISVIVGAEGGFTAEELQHAENSGAKPVSLGSRILRAETAALYALSLIIDHLDRNL
jgi:16S rRNA (uracil1498-N3)-methyltransferase